MIKPLRLKPGGTIGIVNPSYWLKEEFLIKTVKIMEARGYKIRLGKSPGLKDHLYAGTPEERADDLMNMFMNPEIDAIVCARGGYGCLPQNNFFSSVSSYPIPFTSYPCCR